MPSVRVQPNERIRASAPTTDTGVRRRCCPPARSYLELLKFLAYNNLYTWDNSVFPVSPAAQPSRPTVALALRLASPLKS
jgi:choline dehydrogenase-like flavoprotein